MNADSDQHHEMHSDLERRAWRRLVCGLLLVGSVGCAIQRPSASDAAGVDSALSEVGRTNDVIPTDGGSSTGDDALVADVPIVTPTGSRAGEACADDSMCSGLRCDRSVAGGYCSGPCVNNASQTNEAMQCGGAGTTCLTSGEGAMEQSRCAKACNPASMNTGCRPGQVCTGFWVSRMSGPDRAGCFPFCTTNDQCPTGMMCNARTGVCGMATSNPAGLPDGSPCTIPTGTAPSPCRGICFRLVTGSNRGVCGSLINTNVTRDCPDSPMEILPRAPMGDNLAYCLFRDCSSTQCCPAGLVCEGMGDMGVCVPDDPMDPNIACGR
jgi:hypothetical protein